MKDARDAVVETLRALVGFDSTSRLTNRPVVDWLEPRLIQLGFRCERHAYRDESGVEKLNLLASSGTSVEHPELALVGHTDCVPFDAAWSEALTLRERDGKLYGRGACDTKAFIACALVAAERTRMDRLARPLRLVFTADEEVGCVGAKALVDARKGAARYAIVGEPTSLTPVRANKGYCLAEVEVSGREGHSAYPESGASAIFGAAHLLQRIEAYANGPLREDTDAVFEPPFTTLNVGMISGGRAKNVIPGTCTFTLEWRPIPGQPVERVPQDVERLLAAFRHDHPGAQARLRVARTDRGVDTPAGSEVVRFLVEETGRDARTVSFGTEAPQMTALGAEAVVFGPGDIRVAHQTGEFVPRDELFRCESILEKAIRRFCS